MTRSLVIQVGDERFPGELELERAPRTCAAVQDALPIDGHLLHARWSGQCVWVPLERGSWSLEPENATSFPSPGQVLLYAGPLSDAEILIPYGAATFTGIVGPLPGSHFLTITDGLDRLCELGQRVLWGGAQAVSIDVV